MIRSAGQGDWEAVRGIFREYATSLPSGHICFETFEQELGRLEDGFYSAVLLAVDDDQIAGCVAARSLDRESCELKRLYIRPSWRGRGIGRDLVDAVIDHAKLTGHRWLRLDTMPEMSSAQALYRSAGFQITKPYANNPPEAICMALELV